MRPRKTRGANTVTQRLARLRGADRAADAERRTGFLVWDVSEAREVLRQRGPIGAGVDEGTDRHAVHEKPHVRPRQTERRTPRMGEAHALQDQGLRVQIRDLLNEVVAEPALARLPLQLAGVVAGQEDLVVMDDDPPPPVRLCGPQVLLLRHRLQLPAQL